MIRKHILFLDETALEDLPLVGGKGANLGEMIKTGFPVPFGFCVTTESYKDFIEQNNLSAFIANIIKDASLDNIQEIGARLRDEIKKSIIPKQIEQEIIKAIGRVGADNYYAIRSSATAEDLPFASFAGQQDTYLNIKGIENLLDSIRDCWASLFTDRAVLYRIQNNIDHEKVQMPVVIQEMITPEVSGIMFTADPVSGHRDIISIDASYGLGEALVSGLITPDIYKYRKSSGQIQSITVAEKHLAIIPLEVGGTKKVEITAEKAKSQALSDSQISQLAELGKDIERHYGYPQDIEWCISKDKLYIVQSRAITSLFPLPEPIPQDNALHIYLSFNHFQVMTDPISPLGIDMLRIIASFDQGARSSKEYKYMKSAAGRIYVDVTKLIRNKTLGKRLPTIMNNADALMAIALREAIDRPDFSTNFEKNKAIEKVSLRFFKPIIINAIKNLSYRPPEGTLDFFNDYIEKRVCEAEKEINEAGQGIAKLEAIYKVASFTEDFRILLPKMACAMISFMVTGNLEEKLLGTRKFADQIVKGLEGNITTEMGLLTGDLADMIRQSPELMKEFENGDYPTLLTRISELEGQQDFKLKFNDFLSIYDMRAHGEIDIAKDRWIENPEPLVKSILAIAKTATHRTHRQEYQETIVQAKKAAETFIEEVKAKHGRLKTKISKRVVRVLRNTLPIREHPKYLIMKLVLICKKALLEEAKIFVQKGYLKTEKDIFYVGFWELYDSIQEDKSLISLVEQRKEEYRHYQKLTPPRVLTSDGEEIKANYQQQNLPEGALLGMPVSAGVVEGIAKVITDPAKSSINKGEILVAPFTDPGWTPLFINATGLVMEIGGLLTHGTVVAREYGIPAVVGITGATQKIKTGQRIRVDGDTGIVSVLRK